MEKSWIFVIAFLGNLVLKGMTINDLEGGPEEIGKTKCKGPFLGKINFHNPSLTEKLTQFSRKLTQFSKKLKAQSSERGEASTGGGPLLEEIQ